MTAGASRRLGPRKGGPGCAHRRRRWCAPASPTEHSRKWCGRNCRQLGSVWSLRQCTSMPRLS
eukprot:363880-Chlamydomonas_euryale.AAC.4